MHELENQPVLNQDEVHVWNISLHDGADHYPLLDMPDVLSSEELARYGRISQLLLRQRYLRSRAALRLILGAYTGIEPGAIRYSYNENGKPAIGSAAPEKQIAFNLSHSADRCLLSVTQKSDVGIDIEYCRGGRDYMALARRFFTEAELQLLENSSVDALFYRMWVLKEASVKARGMKLLAGLDRFECSLERGEALEIVDLSDRDNHYQWSHRIWQPHQLCVAAVVVKKPAAVFIDREFNAESG